MPKALSLKKKGQQTREQLPITTFFKNVVEKKPSQSSSINVMEDPPPSIKRKASSPISACRNKVMLESSSNASIQIESETIPLIKILDSPPITPSSTQFFDKVPVDSQDSKCDLEPDLNGAQCQYGFTAKCNNTEIKQAVIRRPPSKHKHVPMKSVPSPIKCQKSLGNHNMLIEANELSENTNILQCGSPITQSPKSPEMTEEVIKDKLILKFSVNVKESQIKTSKNETENLGYKELKKNVPLKLSDAKCRKELILKENRNTKTSPIKSSPVLNTSSTIKVLGTPLEIIAPPKQSDGGEAYVTGESDIKQRECGAVDTFFEEEWGMNDFAESQVPVESSEEEDLDLGEWQRCEIVSVVLKSDHSSEVKLKDRTGKRATCNVEGIWNSLPLQAGDTVSVWARREELAGRRWVVSDRAGLLVLQPDVLLSSTAVAGAVFCRRKAVLQENFRGIHPPNRAMTIGILVHELLQLALQKRLCTVAELQRAASTLLSTKASMHLLYDADLALDEALHEINSFVPQVVRFVDEHVVNQRSSTNKGRKADEWCGRVEKVLDIEENIVTPQLGLKGKIDVTLLVNIHNRKGGETEVVPLELKTGRASVSAEHRGQLILYMMMMSLQGAGRAVSRGLLLYLRDIITLKVVTCGYPEQRDLLMLRNQLAQYLAPKSKNKATKSENSSLEDNAQIEGNGASELRNLELPEPINHHACGKCEYLTLCSLYQWHTKGPDLGPEHNLSKLRQEALGHLSEAHVEYFLRWTALLLLEDLDKHSTNPLHHIWTVPPLERERRGCCLSGLEAADVQPSGDRFLHTFIRHQAPIDSTEGARGQCTLGVGDYVVISTERQVWVAAGLITHMEPDIVCIALERDLTERNTAQARYHADAYESQRQLGFNLTNLAALTDNDDKSHRLRRLIIDRSEAEFTERLPREVGRVGARLLKPLNLLQQRAVLRAVAAQDYTLVHGMPGTGKTQTVVVLVQTLVALGQRVLVTAHTHSAVDNVLQRLPQEMRVLRLGSSARVSPQLARCSEDTLAARCTTPDDLRRLYDSMDVVGVTCLGAGHSLLSKCVFDVCIVDESTQVVQSTVLRPLMAARRFVLVGDPEQLPPLVRSTLARKLGMDESLFSRLHGTDATVSLSAQYRMNARVAALANRFTYDGRLTCASRDVADAHIPTDLQKVSVQYSSSHPWLVDCLSPRLERSVLLVDTGCTATRRDAAGGGDAAAAGGRPLMSNAAEALVVLAILKALFLAGLDPDSIGVITPYRDQVSLLNKCVGNLQNSLSPRRRSPREGGGGGGAAAGRAAPRVEVNTVDQYQGRDKSVIIYSCCKTWDPEATEYSVKDSEILEDKRRLTVAITRAKHKLIVVGDTASLRHYSTFGQLFRCLRELDEEQQTCSELRLQEPFDSLLAELGVFL